MWHSTSGTRNESVTSIGKSSSSCGGMTHLSGRYAKGRATSGTSGEAIAEEGGPGRARRFGFAGGLASWPAMMTPATSPGWPRRRRPLQHALVGRELKAQRRLTSAPTKMSPITAFGERQWTVHCGVRLGGARETGLIRWCCGRSTIRRCRGFPLGPASPPIRRLAYTMALDAVGSLVSASAVRAF
jgi:hypothetical protein